MQPTPPAHPVSFRERYTCGAHLPPSLGLSLLHLSACGATRDEPDSWLAAQTHALLSRSRRLAGAGPCPRRHHPPA